MTDYLIRFVAEEEVEADNEDEAIEKAYLMLRDESGQMNFDVHIIENLTIEREKTIKEAQERQKP